MPSVEELPATGTIKATICCLLSKEDREKIEYELDLCSPSGVPLVRQLHVLRKSFTYSELTRLILPEIHITAEGLPSTADNHNHI